MYVYVKSVCGTLEEITMPPEEYIGYLIARTNRNLRKRMTTLLTSFDLTTQQYRVLRRLYEEDGLPARELVIRLSSDSSTIMNIIDRLEEKELVRRDPDPADRRVNRILLTPQAKSILPKITKRIAVFKEATLKLLSPRELEAMRSGLTKLDKLAVGYKKPE